MRREHRWNVRGASQRLFRHLPLARMLAQHGHSDDPLRVIATSRNAKPLNIERMPALEGLTSETDALAEFMRRPASSL